MPCWLPWCWQNRRKTPKNRILITSKKIAHYKLQTTCILGRKQNTASKQEGQGKMDASFRHILPSDSTLDIRSNAEGRRSVVTVTSGVIHGSLRPCLFSANTRKKYGVWGLRSGIRQVVLWKKRNSTWIFMGHIHLVTAKIPSVFVNYLILLHTRSDKFITVKIWIYGFW